MHSDRSIVESDLKEIATEALPWQRLEGATVLVTGATGLIGGYLVEALAARSRLFGSAPTRIIALARSAARASSRFAHLSPNEVTIVEHQLDAPIRLDEHADFVVHGASPATPTQFAADPVGTYLPNVLGTHFLLQWASEHGTSRFLFLSSGSVHGPLPPTLGTYSEHVFGPVDPLDPYSCYSESKRMGESECVAWHQRSGLAATIARLGHTYGPGLDRADTRSFAEFVFAAVDGRDIVLRSAGTAMRPFCYLTDAITGLLLALLDGEAGDAYFVVNTEAVMTIAELANTVVRLAPPPGISLRLDGEPVLGAHPPGPDDTAMPDVSRLRSLGWAPKVLPEEGFRRTIAAHRHG